jgi:hypothetical protein
VKFFPLLYLFLYFLHICLHFCLELVHFGLQLMYFCLEVCGLIIDIVFELHACRVVDIIAIKKVRGVAYVQMR